MQTLVAISEGAGVSQCDCEKNCPHFTIALHGEPVQVRVHDDEHAICVFREVASEMAFTALVANRLNEFNTQNLLFRAFWQDDTVFVRADVPADPLIPSQLQVLVDEFEGRAEYLANELSDLAS